MKHILMKLMLLCATAPALTSCIDDNFEGSTASDKDTYIHLNVSTAALQTRASDESAANPNSESDIKSVRVWAFNSDLTAEGVLPVSYKEETNLTKNSSYTLSMKIPRNSGGTELKNLDLFILANAESGSNLYGDKFSPKEVTRKDLQEAKLSDKFVIGTDGKPTDGSVPTTGLPISRYVTGIDVDSYKSETETSSSAKSLSIPMQRAVSKIHFYFARKEGSDAAQAEVTKIELDGGNLSKGSYVFPDGADYAKLSTEGLKKTNGTMEYISDKASLMGVSTENIKSVSEPKDFVRGEDEDASVYLSRLSTAGITSQDLAYYNETDKAISGTIYYKVYGSEYSKSFSIPAEATSRNHELLVYGYFNTDGHLELNYSIIDWDKTANTKVKTKDLSYLNVYPTLVFMRNVTENQEVNFSASNTCTVNIEEVYYYDKDNKKQTIAEGSNQYPTVNISTTDKQGLISITSTLPNENVANNLTVKYIKLKVKLNDSDKEQEVLVKQYPLEYAQNIAGKYSSRSTSGWVSDINGGKNATYQDYSYQYQWYGYKYTGYGYRAKIYVDNNSSIKYYYGGNRYESSEDYNTGLTNRYMYVIQITSTNGKYTIAHPTLEPDGSSKDNVVSPAFMIASQLGAVASSGFDETKAISHCQTYREVATDGTKYDNWRLPTEAEVKIIIEYQGKKNSPIADVLTGQYYRTLSKGTAHTGFDDEDSQGIYVRCVRDLSR